MEIESIKLFQETGNLPSLQNLLKKLEKLETGNLGNKTFPRDWKNWKLEISSGERNWKSILRNFSKKLENWKLEISSLEPSWKLSLQNFFKKNEKLQTGNMREWKFSKKLENSKLQLESMKPLPETEKTGSWRSTLTARLFQETGKTGS